MTKTRSYSLTLEPYDNGYLAIFPALPGCQTWGRSYEQAVKNAEEALAVYLETLEAHGDPIPDQGEIEGRMSLGVMVRTPIVA